MTRSITNFLLINAKSSVAPAPGKSTASTRCEMPLRSKMLTAAFYALSVSDSLKQRALREPSKSVNVMRSSYSLSSQLEFSLLRTSSAGLSPSLRRSFRAWLSLNKWSSTSTPPIENDDDDRMLVTIQSERKREANLLLLEELKWMISENYCSCLIISID